MKSLYELALVRLSFGPAEILRGISLDFREAEMVTIVGPNGAGKSTLMSILSGFRREYEGHCFFRGLEIGRWDKRALARLVAFVPQMIRIEFPFTAEQVALMGRTPYCHGLFESPEDREVVRCAMATTNTLQFATREFRALSGGERQRVILAGALAQQPSVLLVDEPTTFLDLKHQISTYTLLHDQTQKGMTVIAVTHDLNLAAAYSDRMIVLSEGRVAADGKPEEVLQPRLLAEVFEAETEIRKGPSGRPWVLYGKGLQASVRSPALSSRGQLQC